MATKLNDELLAGGLRTAKLGCRPQHSLVPSKFSSVQVENSLLRGHPLDGGSGGGAPALDASWRVPGA